MAIDTPARLAILGAGPIGLEASLYARFLGYDVAIYEAGDVAASVRRWGHVRMFTPFGMNHSSLALAAIQAQDESYQPPPEDSLLTGREWIDRYLLPLSQTDLLADHLRLQSRVLVVGKDEVLKGEMPGHPDRGDWSFRVLSQDAAGVERIESFDGVLDCTGVFMRSNWLGHGGIPAIGETAIQPAIEYRLPDILGADREHYAGRHTLLIGSGMSAATNVVALGELAKSGPGTRVTWITRREGLAATGPIAVIANDRLPQRTELARAANALALKQETPAKDGPVVYWPITVVEAVARRGDGFTVELSGQHAGQLEVDHIIANVGFRPDNRLYEELQIHECYASQGPMKLAAALAGSAGSDCLDQKSCGASSLLNPEPNFYILGHKSYGRSPNFLFQLGLAQIREVFSILGDRETLDLYSGAKPLLK